MGVGILYVPPMGTPRLEGGGVDSEPTYILTVFVYIGWLARIYAHFVHAYTRP